MKKLGNKIDPPDKAKKWINLSNMSIMLLFSGQE